MHTGLEQVGGLEENGGEDARAQAGEKMDFSADQQLHTNVVVKREELQLALDLHSHEDDERDFPPSDIAALSICVLIYC